MSEPNDEAPRDHDAGVTAGAIRVFAYGSLIPEPELPDRVQHRVVARLQGWHRVFNTRSVTRGCPAGSVPPGVAVPGFEEDGDRRSLVLGTAEGGHIDGVLFTYPAIVGDDLLARLRRREGPGYQRRQVHVATAAGDRLAHAWLTAPDSQRRVDLPLAEQAAILAAATPIHDVDGRARGADYLFDVVVALASVGVVDDGLERLVAATRSAIAHRSDPGYS